MNQRSNNFLFEKNLEWEQPADGIRRQIMGYDEDIMLVKILFKRGAVGTPHTHFHVQTTYVAKGVFEVEINGEKQLLREGDGFYVEPDAQHGVVCVEDGVLIDVFSPMRKDFLKTM
ncbi:MAG: cupin domain-containing protein [Rikenellaceae bacterium]